MVNKMAEARTCNGVTSRDPACGSTPRHTAATTVATPDQACDAWWNVLVCALWRAAIDRSDVMGIAGGALDRGGLIAILDAVIFSLA